MMIIRIHFKIYTRNDKLENDALKKTEECLAKEIKYRGPQIWNLIADNIQNISSLQNFKREIKKWKCENHPCKICKTYLENIGFM